VIYRFMNSYPFNEQHASKREAQVPAETIICFSRRKGFTSMVLFIAVLFTGIGILARDSIFLVFFFAVPVMVLVYLIYAKYREATNRMPQIILNDRGIQTVDTDGFYSWADIKNECVVPEGFKDPDYLLVFDYPKGRHQLRINDFAVSPSQLNKLLRLYRERFGEQASHNS